MSERVSVRQNANWSKFIVIAKKTSNDNAFERTHRLSISVRCALIFFVCSFLLDIFIRFYYCHLCKQLIRSFFFLLLFSFCSSCETHFHLFELSNGKMGGKMCFLLFANAGKNISLLHSSSLSLYLSRVCNIILLDGIL